MAVAKKMIGEGGVPMKNHSFKEAKIGLKSPIKETNVAVNLFSIMP